MIFSYLKIAFLEAVPIGDGMQIGEKIFLPDKEETRRNPDGFQEFLTQPDEKFPSRCVSAPIGTASYTTSSVSSPRTDRKTATKAPMIWIA